MKTIYLILATITTALLFSACGSGGDTFDTGEEKVVIVTCDTNTTTLIQPNDLLVKDSANTTVTVTHNSDDTKEICVETGSAHLIREK